MRALLAVLWKDLLTEWRSRERLSAMGAFALVVVVILYLAAPPPPGAETPHARAGLLWIAYAFAAVLGLNRTFALELENQAISGLALASVERGLLFLGKALASFPPLALVWAGAALVFGLAFGVDFRPVLGGFALVAGLGALGVCGIGTLFAAMAVRSSHREILLPLLLLPLLAPLLLGCARATDALLESGALPWPQLQLLLVTDGVFWIVSYLGFGAVLDD